MIALTVWRLYGIFNVVVYLMYKNPSNAQDQHLLLHSVSGQLRTPRCDFTSVESLIMFITKYDDPDQDNILRAQARRAC
jgi:hypothetical protein